MFGKKKTPDASQYPSDDWGGEFGGQYPEQQDLRAPLSQWPAPVHEPALEPAEELAREPAQPIDTEPVDTQVTNALAEVSARLSALESAQAAQIGALAEQLQDKDQTLTAMNDALSQSRRDQVAVLLTPAAKKIIDLEQQARSASLQQREGAGSDQAAADFDFFADKLADALESLGFERVECETGTPFDARRHQAVKMTVTEVETLDKTVATVLRPGYAFAGSARTAFPTKVIVNEYVHTTAFEEN